ncbi:DNA mismatch repair ATPase msh1, partial [Tulasnella sp. 417]
MLCRPLSLVNTRRKFQQIGSNALHSAQSRIPPSDDAIAPKRRGRPPKRNEDASSQDPVPSIAYENPVINGGLLHEEGCLEAMTRSGVPSEAIPGDASSSPNHPLRKTRVKKRFSDLPIALNGKGGAAAPLDPDWRQTTKKSASLVPTLIPSVVNTSPTAPTGSSLPTTQLAVDIIENLAKFPHCILLTRVGNFYESYFDQAIEVAQLLTIKLTTRLWGGGRVPMAGFPLAHLDRHLKRLVQGHKRFAAICEEFKSSDGGFERRVVRVVTPGTLIDESFVNPFENNYLMAISGSESDDQIGMAWTDVATGEFFTQTIPQASLRDEVARIRPKEVVLQDALRTTTSHPIKDALVEESAVVSFIRSGVHTRSPIKEEDDLSVHETEA